MQLLPPSALGPLFFVLYPHFSGWLSPLSWLLLTNVEKHWINQGLLPTINIGEKEAPNMWTEPTGIMNKIPVSTHWRLAHPKMPNDHTAVPRHSPLRHEALLLTFSNWVTSKSEESLPPSLLSTLCQRVGTYQVSLQNPCNSSLISSPLPESRSGLKSLQYWHFEEDNSCYTGCPMCSGLLNSISGLYPLHVSKIIPSPIL